MSNPMINELKDNEIFVFGSNLAGNHAGGAAKQAHDQFGAEMGVGEGMTGQCYAFPTLTETFSPRTLGDLEASRDKFYEVYTALPNKMFLMTAVGTGIAGYPKEVMKYIFLSPPVNVVLPEEWV